MIITGNYVSILHELVSAVAELQWRGILEKEKHNS